jgi:hypothetical protein
MKKLIYIFLATSFSFTTMAQQAEPVEETFRSIYLVNGQSSETLWDGFLFFAITHRFTAPISGGAKEFWGMDSYSNVRLGLAYGITDDLMIGIGRTRLDKIYDGYLKYKILKQREQGMPITLTGFGQIGIKSDDFPEDQAPSLGFEDRLSYAAQLMIARKITNWLSIQVTPTYTHQNLTTRPDQPNARFSLGATVHAKITAGTSLLFEYYFNEFTEDPNSTDVVGFSIDFTSVKHSFQIQLTNATSIIPAEFLAYTNRDFFSSDGLFLGFHITRKFDL